MPHPLNRAVVSYTVGPGDDKGADGDSNDGKSPDASCIWASYKRTMCRLVVPADVACKLQSRLTHKHTEGSKSEMLI